MSKLIGLTKDAGFQMGIRRTYPVPVELAWPFLFSKEGIALWLGPAKDMRWEKDEVYHTREGIEGKVSVFKPFSHVRITWKKKAWPTFSTVQMRTIKSRDKTVMSFHQDRLISEQQREEMLVHWEEVLSKLDKKIK